MKQHLTTKGAVIALVCVLTSLVVALAATTFTTLPRQVTLAGFVTPLAGRTHSQRHNALLAAQRLNGCRIAPGQTFSFNGRVGTFSRDQGYRRAPVSYNGQLISDWGGGVCQVSTTLYNAALLSDLSIVERNRHRFCPSYVSPGRDAAVAFSNIDLRFKNTYPFPIWIHAYLDEQFIHCEIEGLKPLKQRPLVIERVTRVGHPETYTLGHPSAAARVRNSGKNGYEVSVYRVHGSEEEFISHDNYPTMNRVVQYR